MSPKTKGIKPSQFDKKTKINKEPLVNKIPSNNDNIPEEEKMRLLNQTGLLQKVKKREEELKQQKQEPATTAEHIYMAIFLSIPFAILLATFDVVVKVQYFENWSYTGMALKAIKSAPALAPFIYLTSRYRSERLTQASMSVIAVFAGSFLMYTIKHTPSLGQMMRAPGLATVWIYLIVQLDLLPATLSLLVVGFYWYFGIQQKLL
ncbi:hypothetical protein G6F46_008647 [Rhizopus delemar]|uniref:DUF7719 domain-containing protein n=3 Tax=Rhizopus TaxID=4842 RepID=I1C2E2_RHIO9|nr:hypothetical protein RO3G_07327 [Rhizopus delemar RA 99-880]KAG1051528.1 hypothetical protein G6F43_006266 [Rhizopus delemar]KAG1539857.1 hypothetical protein G6F51_008882 [Rhizopus arrhizus]KAG1465661.1 hypothetical protein G6F55_000991 [Rhizopus delemar]KAG1494069.1 hypothetical protein G6F54_008138 [Rhizopus delemar]|eukprot:EIE82622.1 hypothetical protein RO3G_07327 [Rhizopus delemar RA 99-880]